MDNSQNVLVLGGASWNTMVHLPKFPEPRPQTITNARFVEGVGSTGVGKAFALKSLGFEPTLHVAVGNDQFGDKIVKGCLDRGIEMLVERYRGETAQYLNLMDDQGDRISIFRTNGPDELAIEHANVEAKITSADVIYVNLATSTIPTLATVQASAATVVVDLHDYEPQNQWYDQFIEVADIIQLSNEKVEREFELAAELLNRGVKTVAITKGKDGAQLINENERVFVEPVPARLVDSNGAGDTFCVSLAQSLVAGSSLYAAGEFAAHCAAQTVETHDIAPESFSRS